MFLKRKMNDFTNSYSDKILQIKEKIGDIGVDISILIDIWMHQNRYIRTCMNW